MTLRGFNFWRGLFSGRMVVISLDCKLDVLNSTLLMDYMHILDTLQGSIINTEKPKKHYIEINKVCA